MVSHHGWRCTNRLQRCHMVSWSGAVSLWTHGRLSRSMLVPTKPEHGGQQRDRGQHGAGHHRGGADAQAADERQAHGQHADQGDDHGEAGEQHGPPGGVDGGDHRLLGVEAGLERLAIAGDDEQGVVDAHADADHGGQDGGERLEREDVGEQLDDGQPDGQTRSARPRWAGPWPAPSRRR